MKQLLCSLLVFAFCCVHAQSHFQPGKVLPNTGDTLRGEIDYGNWAVNPRTIRFRSGPGGAHVYSVADLRYFEVDGMDSYFRAPVTKDMRPIAESGMAMAGSSDTTAQDTVWLRVLVQGKRLSLFELIDSKPHFYIQDTPGVYTELRYQRFLRTDMVDVIQEDNGFQNQLMVYLPDSGSKGLQMRIEHASYSEGSLTRMVSALNGQQPVHRPGGTDFRFYAGAGILSGSLKFTTSAGNIVPVIGMPFSHPISPSGYIGLDMVRRRNRGDLGLRVELGYWAATYKGTSDNPGGYNYYATIKQSTIAPFVGLAYYFYRERDFRLFVLLGTAMNISTYPTSQVVTIYPGSNSPPYTQPQGLQGFWFEPQLRVGAQLFDKMSIEAIGAFFNNVVTDYELYKGATSQYGLKVSYYFKGTH